jgi:hypothetical protein
MASGVFSIRQQAQAAGHGAWTGSQTTPYVEYLVVAGGGGGGDGYGSGAGAGGLLQGISNVTVGSSITVTVGSGGTGSTAVSNNATQGGSSVFGSISTVGGGVGPENGSVFKSIMNGGSGGGASYASINPGQGTFGQGNAGGTFTTGATYYSLGGGGAGTVGLANTSSNAGNGGAGIASVISGTVTAYAGGGGGGTYQTAAGTQGTGGVGGGGSAGTAGGNNAGGAGTPNTGGGGGGASFQSAYAAGGNGGSGIVIISYPDTYNAPASFGGANSPTASTSGSGSLSFNGSSQYLVSGTSSNFSLGTSDFSVECWVYKTSTSGNQVAIGSSITGNLDPLFFYFNNGSNLAVLYLSSNGTTFNIASSVGIGTVSLNTWAHLAVTRVGTTFTTYLNGVQTSTFSSSASIYQSVNTFTLGAGQTGIQYFAGYISNARILKGSSAYSAAFTPSIIPLTAITNTVLLMNTVSGASFVDSSITNTPFTVTGSPTWNQLSPFATGLGYKNRVYTWTGSGTVTF